jgi:hypothetical protein
MGLLNFIAQELNGKDFAHVDVKKLYEAAGDRPTYTKLIIGLFTSDAGVMGDWSKEEKDAVRAIFYARNQGHSLGHEFGKAMTGYDDPNVAKHKDAYQTIERMIPGDIARLRVDEEEYFTAMFSARMPATGLVLFVK